MRTRVLFTICTFLAQLDCCIFEKTCGCNGMLQAIRGKCVGNRSN